MDAFEELIAKYLEDAGYWVRTSVKINITAEDKKKIGLPSMPRPEIDLVAFDFKKNILILFEVKSYLDSSGVNYMHLMGTNKKYKKRYRLFNDNKYREIVTLRLKEQYEKKGLINKDTDLQYALAAGNIRWQDEQKIKEHFAKEGWKLFTPNQIKDWVKELVRKGWEDNLIIITAKLILRDKKHT